VPAPLHPERSLCPTAGPIRLRSPPCEQTPKRRSQNDGRNCGSG
jgi:hypothetical protein